MIIIPPRGMRHDLAYMLVNNVHFAHMWLCHAGGTCPDGCDTHASPKRREVYESIKVYHTAGDLRAYQRGQQDRSVGQMLFIRTMWGTVCPLVDDDVADMWEDSHKEAYCDGWEAEARK